MSRLIDADALRESIITRQTEMSYEDAWALTCVDNAPTIEPDWTGLMVICDNCGHAIHVKRIDVKPAIEPQKWIPVSERSPQKSGNYIVTERRYSMDDRKHEGKYQTIVEEVRFTGEKWDRAKFFDIIAWMPLPEPWKGEEG